MSPKNEILSEVQLAVLQAITDRVSSVHQITSREKVLEDLRGHPKWEVRFEGEVGKILFATTLVELVNECLVEERVHKGQPYLKVTSEALAVEGLLVDLDMA